MSSSSVLVALAVAQPAAAQTRVVSACSGVSLPPSVVTNILSPVLTGITGPLETTVNGILGAPLLNLLIGPLNLNTTGLINQAASGAPITLQLLATDGNVIGPADQCRVTSDSITLDAAAGVAIGGNQISGLGASGVPAFASDINAIALGNNARAEAGALGSLALGANSQAIAANSVALGAGSVAGRGARFGYTATGLAGPQFSAGAVSIGAPGALRQLTNIAAGSAPTDAATVGQVDGVLAQVSALGAGTIQYDGALRTRATLAGATGTTLANLAPGALAAGSTEAVNGAQLFATNQAVAGIDTRVVANTTQLAALNASALRYDAADRAAITLGGAGGTVLGNVAAGAVTGTSLQAVNGAQLFATNQVVAGIDTRVVANTTQLAALNASALRYDAADRAAITLGGAGGTVLGNVAAGAVTGTSLQAVNGAQLFATNQVVAGATAAITSLDARVTNTETLIVNNATAITNLGAALGNQPLRYADALTPTLPNGGALTDDVTLTGAGGGTVALHNLRAGVIAAGSSDAVNGDQLAATNQAVGTNTAAIAGLDTRLTGTAGSLAALDAVAIRYDGADHGTVTLGGIGGTILDNIAPGTLAAASRQGVNGAQLFATNLQVAANTAAIAGLGAGVAGPLRYSTATSPTLPNGGTVTDDVVLAGASGGAVGLHNVAQGAVAAGSTDAVNGAQLFATAQAVVGNTAAIAGLDTRVTTTESAVAGLQAAATGTGNAVAALTTQVAANTGAIDDLATALASQPLRYVDAATPTVPNGGALSDDATLTGASGGAVRLHNLRAGVVAAGSTDAVNGDQLAQTNQQIADFANLVEGTAVSPIQYSNAATPTQANGGTLTNDVTIVGAVAAAPVAVHNIAAGAMTAVSTDAVNGAQLYATDQVAQQAAALGANSVQYDGGRAAVTFSGNGGAPTTLRNVAAGTAPSDAVNVGQMQAGMAEMETSVRAYADARMNAAMVAVDFDLKQLRRDVGAGTSAAMAAAALPQANEPGRTMIAIGGGTYRGQSSVAFGASTFLADGHSILRLGATYDSGGHGGANAGFGYQF